jgi:hypothetical protein
MWEGSGVIAAASWVEFYCGARWANAFDLLAATSVAGDDGTLKTLAGL